MGGGKYLSGSIDKRRGCCTFLLRARYKERASAGKWRPAIPAAAVNFGPTYDHPWAWLCGPGPALYGLQFLIYLPDYHQTKKQK